MSDNLEHIRVNLKSFEDENKKPFQSISFSLSLLGSSIAIGLLLLLIFFLPNGYPSSDTSSTIQIIYDNFIFNVVYYFNQVYYVSPEINGTYFYYIIITIIILLLIICGTGFFVTNKKARNVLILYNWILYIVLMIVYLIYFKLYVFYFTENELFHCFGTIPILLNVPIQIALLIDGNSFLDWTKFKISKNEEFVKKDFIYRRIVASLFLLPYFFIAIIPILITSNLQAFDYHEYYFFGFAVGLPIYLVWFFVGEVLRIIVTNKEIERRILFLISKGELSIYSISLAANADIRKIQRIITNKINKGEIMAELSYDNMQIIPREPELFFSEERSLDKTDKVESKIEKKITYSSNFWFTISTTIIAVFAFSFIMVMIPNKEFQTNDYSIVTSGSNFCFSWQYYVYDHTGYYRLDYFRLNIGFYILAIIGIISLSISFFGYYENKSIGNINRTHSILNLGLYSIPVIISIIMTAIVVSNGRSYSNYVKTVGLEYSTIGLIYFVPFIYLQISMLIENKSFKQWFGISMNENRTKKIINYGRLINGIVFLLMFAWMWFYPIALMIPIRPNRIIYSITLLNIFMVAWWLYSDLLRNVINIQQKKSILKGIFQLNVTNTDGIASKLEMPKEFVEDYMLKLALKENQKIRSLDSYDETDISNNVPNTELQSPSYISNKTNPKIIRKGILSLFSIIISVLAISLNNYLIAHWFGRFVYLYMISFFIVLIGLYISVHTSYFTKGKIGYVLNGLILLELSIIMSIILY
ncbi:MAG TPA: hypothetical protein VMZ29_11670 [Candidatus Bathyarchaeia archaeon]|nr:hypothetical protein [Candidatus Bathyarchaeia archaeon]